jgi:nanoRNase/pAp phosphatase (c-di-AMP/oligoRNAs hydrolase)
MDPPLATAAAYAITSETQDLDRDADPADLAALQRLLPQVRWRVLGHLRHPRRERDYYRTIGRALRHVVVSQNACICHIGAVAHAELVAEIADFLAAMERISWCLVTGYHAGRVVVSIRTRHPRAHAERVIRKILGKQGKGGGHGTIAGGLMPCESPDDYLPATALLTNRFLGQINRRLPQSLRPLIEEVEF